MRLKLQLVLCNDQGNEETVTDVITLNKHHQRIEHLGLTLAESKPLLSTLQRHLLQQQVTTFLDTCSDGPDCGTPLHLKARSRRSFRTLFGTFTFDSPRLEHCDCTRHQTASFRPLSALLTESVAPELLSMEAKWSSLVSYGMSLDALQDFLPLDLSLDVKTVRYDTLKVAKRLEAELGEEQASFIEGDPSEWELLPLPDGSFKVGIDGGYVQSKATGPGCPVRACLMASWVSSHPSCPCAAVRAGGLPAASSARQPLARGVRADPRRGHQRAGWQQGGMGGGRSRWKRPFDFPIPDPDGATYCRAFPWRTILRQ